MAQQNLWQLIKEKYSRVLPSITTILTGGNSRFLSRWNKEKMLRNTIAFRQKHILSLRIVSLKNYFMKKSTYRLSIAFYLCTYYSLCMECLLSLLPLPTFPEPAQVELSIQALPCLPRPHSFWALTTLFSISIIIISMLQCSLCNYLSVWTQLETSNTGNIASLLIFASPAPISVPSTEQGLGSGLLNVFTTIVWIFHCWGPELLRVQWLQ